MYFEDIPGYRDTIMKTLCKNESVVELLKYGKHAQLSPKEMPYNTIFPYNRIITKATDAGVYICYDVKASRIENRTFTDFRIDFWIIAHERCMNTGNGLVTDLLTSEVDKLINGSRCFGIGRTELKAWDVFYPAEGFYGRLLSYRTVDFNRE